MPSAKERRPDAIESDEPVAAYTERDIGEAVTMTEKSMSEMPTKTPPSARRGCLVQHRREKASYQLPSGARCCGSIADRLGRRDSEAGVVEDLDVADEAAVPHALERG